MGVKITKNTFPKNIAKIKAETITKEKLAVRRGLEVARSSIVPITPVDTSRLKNSINGQSGDSVFQVTQKGQRVVGVIGTNVPYARFVEFGTSRQRPQYYFTRGWNLAKENIRLTIKNTLQFSK